MTELNALMTIHNIELNQHSTVQVYTLFSNVKEAMGKIYMVIKEVYIFWHLSFALCL